MKIKTKFDLDDQVFFKDNDIVYKGRIETIIIHTFHTYKGISNCIEYYILHDSVCNIVRHSVKYEDDCYSSFKEIERTINYGRN